ncbi:MAG TPA: hypothetical protein VER55_11305 [Ardenticatenaceae bacterium]|nr:hypothetical protein [Ardenticatenaceae bacterium]
MRTTRILSRVVVLVGLAMSVAGGVLAASPPLLPFDVTRDLFVLDGGGQQIIRITPSRKISVAVTRDEILAATRQTEAHMTDNGLAVDGDGAVYFTEDVSNAILKWTPGTPVRVLTTARAIMAATDISGADPIGFAFGSDGWLYVTEDVSGSVLRVNPHTGRVRVHASRRALEAAEGITSVNLDQAIVGAEDGILYVISDGRPGALLRIDADGDASVVAVDGVFDGASDDFMTRAADGALVVVDTETDGVIRVSGDGRQSLFLDPAEVVWLTAGNPKLDGTAFDGSGNFYMAESETDSILRFDRSREGAVWVSEADIAAAIGSDPNLLEVGIAFGPGLKLCLPMIGNGAP